MYVSTWTDKHIWWGLGFLLDPPNDEYFKRLQVKFTSISDLRCSVTLAEMRFTNCCWSLIIPALFCSFHVPRCLTVTLSEDITVETPCYHNICRPSYHLNLLQYRNSSKSLYQLKDDQIHPHTIPVLLPSSPFRPMSKISPTPSKQC